MRLFDLLGSALHGTGPAILPLDATLPRARLEEMVAAFAPSAVITIDDHEQLAPAGVAARAGHRADAPGVADDVAVVVPTSGSTGRPKGAELTAPALLASARASLSRLGAAASDRWLCCLPVHHISGLGVLVRSLASGTVPDFECRLDAAGAARAAGRCQYVSLVPTQLRRLLDAGAQLSAFRAVLLGGAAIPPGLLDEAAAAGVRVVTSYGMTETCGGCLYDGLPLDGVRYASGKDGRIRIAGPVLFARYRLDPRQTAATLEDGWFTTSDLGGPGPDGRLVLRGRADDVINTGGEKVVADEVEHALRGCAGVREAAVVAVPDPDWGERVTALVVASAAGAPPTLAGIRAELAGRLPRYAVPQALVIVTEIPMLASGKPDRMVLKELAAQQQNPRT